MRLILLISLLISCHQAHAQEEKNEWPSGSAMAVGIEARENTNKTLEQIDKKYKELVEHVMKNSPNDTRLVKAIKNQHESWLKYYPTECELVGAASGAGGSWPSTWATVCEQDLTGAKLISISSAIECINNIPEGKRKYNQVQCLHQLNVTAKDIIGEQFK